MAPFLSKAQRRFMYANHPEIANEFEAATPKGAKLPEHVKRSKSKKVARSKKRKAKQ